MNYVRRLTLSYDWPTGLVLNPGAPPSERRDVVWLLCTVMSTVVTGGGIKLGPWFLKFSPLTTSHSNRRRPRSSLGIGPVAARIPNP